MEIPMRPYFVAFDLAVQSSQWQTAKISPGTRGQYGCRHIINAAMSDATTYVNFPRCPPGEELCNLQGNSELWKGKGTFSAFQMFLHSCTVARVWVSEQVQPGPRGPLLLGTKVPRFRSLNDLSLAVHKDAVRVTGVCRMTWFTSCSHHAS